MTYCQARVLVHLQSQSQMSKLKRGPELTLKSKCTTHHPPDNFSTSIKGQRSISNLNLNLQCLNSKRTSPPLPNYIRPDQTIPKRMIQEELRGDKRMYEEVVEEGRDPRVPRSKGSKVPDISNSHSNTSLTLKKVHLVTSYFEIRIK